MTGVGRGCDQGFILPHPSSVIGDSTATIVILPALAQIEAVYPYKAALLLLRILKGLWVCQRDLQAEFLSSGTSHGPGSRDRKRHICCVNMDSHLGTRSIGLAWQYGWARSCWSFGFVLVTAHNSQVPLLTVYASLPITQAAISYEQWDNNCAQLSQWLLYPCWSLAVASLCFYNSIQVLPWSFFLHLHITVIVSWEYFLTLYPIQNDLNPCSLISSKHCRRLSRRLRFQWNTGFDSWYSVFPANVIANS